MADPITPTPIIAPVSVPVNPGPGPASATGLPPKSVAIPGEGQAASAIRAQLDALFPHGVMSQEFISGRPVDPAVAITPPRTVPVLSAAPPPTNLPTATPEPVKPAITPPVPIKPVVPVEPVKPTVEPVKPASPTAEPVKPTVEPTDAGKLTPTQLDKAQETMTIKAGTAFKAVRGDLAMAEERLKTLEAEAAALRAKASAVDTTRVQTLEEKVKRYEDELAASRVEATDDFKNNITTPLQSTQAALEALATKYEVSPKDLEKALAEPDLNKRSDILSELSANFNRFDMNRFDKLINDQESLLNARKAALDGASGKFAALQQSKEQAAKEAMIKFHADWTRALDDTYGKLEKEIPVFGKTGDEGWDKMINESKARVQSVDVAALSNDDLASRFYKAEILPMVMSIVSDLKQKNDTLEAANAKLRGDTPPVGGGAAPSLEPIEPKKYTSFAEALKEEMPKIGIPR